MLKRTELTRRAVRQFLAEQGKTQGWLASELDIQQSTLSDILHGRHTPSLGVAMGIERITGVAAERFVQG